MNPLPLINRFLKSRDRDEKNWCALHLALNCHGHPETHKFFRMLVELATTGLLDPFDYFGVGIGLAEMLERWVEARELLATLLDSLPTMGSIVQRRSIIAAIEERLAVVSAKQVKIVNRPKKALAKAATDRVRFAKNGLRRQRLRMLVTIASLMLLVVLAIRSL